MESGKEGKKRKKKERSSVIFKKRREKFAYAVYFLFIKSGNSYLIKETSATITFHHLQHCFRVLFQTKLYDASLFNCLSDAAMLISSLMLQVTVVNVCINVILLFNTGLIG